jgi:dTDP-4-amino-4,6-dideoxygalactose transaminase
MKHNPPAAFKVVKDFEEAVCDYTGAPYCVAVDSCTNAIRLCLNYLWERRRDDDVSVPKHTYISVPMQVELAGYRVEFTDEDWIKRGFYQLSPLPVWDSARLFTSGMWELFLPSIDPYVYARHRFVCLSFHASKHLGIEHGGAILHNAGKEVDYWLRAARHDGRTQGQPISNESVRIVGHHCPMAPSMAAVGLMKMASIPKHNKPLPETYPDLSTFEVFK